MKNTAAPVAYIRKSIVRRGNEGDLSREFQVEEVRRLAGEDGPALRVEAADWGQSARHDKTAKRLAFLAILEAIERGEVTTLYAYSTDRLARSVEWSARLLNACERAGTTIVTSEGRFAPGDDGARVTFQILALMNENAVRAMERKARATLDRRMDRGDRPGNPPYGWRLAARKAGEAVSWEVDPDQSVDAILEAYQTIGSFHGAARSLNDENVPGPRGGKWYGSRVRDILKAQRPTIAAVRQTTARVAHHSGSKALFRRLLHCHCGGIPTPNKQRNGTYSYRCPKGHTDRAEHPVVQVTEAALLPWMMAEAERFQAPGSEVERDDAASDADRARLEGDREYVIDNAVTMRLDKAELARRLAEVDAKLDAIEAETAVTVLEPIDWQLWAPGDVNAVLRAMWKYVELGSDLLPIRAEWRVPAEYVA